MSQSPQEHARGEIVMCRLPLKNIWSKFCVQCGLITNTEAPWRGASPDCFLCDYAEPTSFGIGEMKWPFSKKEMTIKEACEIDPCIILLT